jgi:hypothetical protein
MTAAIGCGYKGGNNPAPEANPLTWTTQVAQAGLSKGTLKLDYTKADYTKVIDGSFGTCVVTLHLKDGTLTYIPSNPNLTPVKDATFEKLRALDKSYKLGDCLPRETSGTRR